MKKKQVSEKDRQKVAYKLIFTDDKTNSTDLKEFDFQKFQESFP
jgi:hypothetical protein